MQQQKKKMLFAIFIILAFGGSTLAWAIDYAFQFIGPKEQQQPDEVDRPLMDSEEAPYLQQNYLIVRYFYTSNCDDCQKAEDAINGLRNELGLILLERISLEKFTDEAESIGVTSAPSIYLKGSSTRLLEGKITYDQLFNEACKLYFNPPLVCG